MFRSDACIGCWHRGIFLLAEWLLLVFMCRVLKLAFLLVSWGLWWLAIGGFYERVIYCGISAAACLSCVY